MNPALIRDKFRAAQAAGDITYYPTQVTVLRCNSFPFQLRYSPALAHKPKSNKPRDPSQKPFNPFLNPSKQLFVAEVAPFHNIVLNKFPVIPDHFILATKQFKRQTDLLEEADLAAAYDCLKAYRIEGEELFGFFNSGKHSGASQPHRHIQFLPVQSMRTGLGEEKWDPLVDSLVGSTVADLPFEYLSAAISADAQASELHDTYRRLYLEACQLVKTGASDSYMLSDDENESLISYNLGLTDKSMVLCPRTSEGLSIKDMHGNFLGTIALNGTLLAGTFLVKSEAEWDTVRKDERILTNVLKAIGIARTLPQRDLKPLDACQ